MTLDELNHMPQAGFVRTLGGVFEHSPWVAERVAGARPFANVQDLHAAMCAAVTAATREEQLALIRAHPELAGRAKIAELTQDSQREQRGAGLDQCSPEEYAQLTALNDAYRQRHGFPFIVAVRGHTRQSIIAAMAMRVDRTTADEQAECLRQIERIAGFRLADLIATV